MNYARGEERTLSPRTHLGREVVDFNADAAAVSNTGRTIVAIDPPAFLARPLKASLD